MRAEAFRWMVVAIAFACAAGCTGDGGEPADSGRTTPPAVINYTPWPMHAVDSRFRGANALSPGDVNQDGLLDYVTNYEFDQRLVVCFHPGPGQSVRLPWPTVIAWQPRPLALGNGVNPEHSALGDFDGDGNLDVVAAQGWSELPFWEGSEPGIRLVWGPPSAETLHEEAWTDAGRIPATIDRGHMIFVLPFDVNGDGVVDIVSGGRVHGGNGRKGGVIWIESPADQAQRRDLNRWSVHDIDPEQFSAHGLVLTDVDADGDTDLALANADFDTPDEEEKILWYENPGTGSSAQKEPWPGHVIYQGGEFQVKPQIAVADLDRDGLNDMLVQLDNDIYYFRKTGLRPVTWERLVIPKDPRAQYPARPIRVADLNRDGRLDLVGMLMHQDGDLPGDKASAFWMEYTGGGPRADNWKTHLIKWGPGKTMLLPIFGEKWDQVEVSDVDGDGDLDFVANCEEWWAQDIEFRFFFDPQVDPTSVAVVWFENRLFEAAFTFEEQDGLCVMEAEHYTDMRDGTWIERSRFPGSGGNGYLQDHRTLDNRKRDWAASQGLEYEVEVKGGEYTLWVRRWAPSEWGFVLADLGRDNSNSAWAGLDGEPLPAPLDDLEDDYDAWVWVRFSAELHLSPGRHTLQLRSREGGYAVDRMLLTSAPAYTPQGLGPAETLQAD